MLSITDLKIGTKVTYENAPYVVIFAQHSKQGRAGSVMRTTLRNLINGAVIEKTFAGGEKLESADLITKKAQFLYKDGSGYHFMRSDDFEQFTLISEQLGKLSEYLKEGEEIDILYYNDSPINVNLPIKIVLEVTYTEPGFRGNTASTVTKPATLETGAQINVPLFIKNGNKIVVDTRTGEYVERA